ncbi:hypothetical protein B484DRAFT_426005 [Ochromonadaceae sp. CCMP2298]|nr:hypothetical protein B484DRAFT_426005 [Ochromonadaceae sp. CCMP2298]
MRAGLESYWSGCSHRAPLSSRHCILSSESICKVGMMTGFSTLLWVPKWALGQVPSAHRKQGYGIRRAILPGL